MADLHTNLLVQHRKYYSTTLFIQSLCRYRRHNTCLYIKTLLKAIIKSENPAMKISGNKVNLNNKELLSKMDGILVLTGTNTRIANMMHEDATKLSHTKEYEHILYRNEKELAIDVFTRESKGVILEIILIDKTDQNNRIIQLMGQFTPDDILSMIKI